MTSCWDLELSHPVLKMQIDDPWPTAESTFVCHVQAKQRLCKTSCSQVQRTLNSTGMCLCWYTNSSQCQKCLEYGHYSYECKATERPYKPRPTRSQVLKNPQLMPKLSIDEPPSTLKEKYISSKMWICNSRAGTADKLLKDREEERQKRRRSESVSTFSSRSSSVSTYSSSEEEGQGDRKRIRRHSRSRSRSSYSSSRNSSRSRGESRSHSPSEPEERGRPRRRSRTVSSRPNSHDSRQERSISPSERSGLREKSPRGGRTSSPSPSPPRRRSPSPRRRRSPSPRRSSSMRFSREEPRARSRWDQPGPSHRGRSPSPYSRRKLMSRE